MSLHSVKKPTNIDRYKLQTLNLGSTDAHANCLQTTLRFDHDYLPAFEEFWTFPCSLAQNGSTPFEVLPAFGFALVYLVVDLAQQLLHQARPTVTVGLDDKGELPKKMRPA